MSRVGLQRHRKKIGYNYEFLAVCRRKKHFPAMYGTLMFIQCPPF